MDLKYKLDHSSRYTVLSPPCEVCVSLKGKLVYATKENTELQQKVTYLIAHLEKTILSEKMIEKDLSRVEESTTKSTYRLSVGIERCENKGEKSALKFILSFTYHKEEATIKPTKTHYPSNTKPSFNPKREISKETSSRERKLLFICFVTALVTWMRFASDARELRGGVLSMLETHIVMSSLISRLILTLIIRLAFILGLRLTLLHELFPSSLMYPHHSYGFDPRENRIKARRFGYGSRPRRGDHFSRRSGFPAGESYTHFEPRHLDGPHFSRRGSHPTQPNGEVERIVKTSSGRVVKC
jgi:hypothetical protein